MSDDSDSPCESFFSKRAKLAPKKTPEELKAAEELLKMIEKENLEKEEAESNGNDAKLIGNKPSRKKGQKKLPYEDAGSSKTGIRVNSQLASNSQPSTSFQPAADTHSAGSSQSADIVHDRTIDDEIEATRLSAASRKRLKKFKDEQEFDLRLIDAKNAMILEGNPFKKSEITDAVEAETIPEEKIFNVTVSYISKVARFKCPENEKFIKVFKDVGDFFHLNLGEFLLCLNDRNISSTDTPNSLCLSEREILECIPYKPGPSSACDDFDDDTLTITFQSNDTKSKTDMVVKKLEPMKAIMERYAKNRNMPLNEFTFEFDGEKILGTETPAELDMETGHCVDVRVFMPLPQCSYASASASDSDQQPSDSDLQPSDNRNYFDNYFQDFIFVDSDSNESDIVVLD